MATKEAFELKVQADARRWLHWMRHGGPTPTQRLTRRIRGAVSRLDPEGYAQFLDTVRMPHEVRDVRPPVAMRGSKLRTELTPAEDVFSGMVLGWHGIDRGIPNGD